MTDVIKTANQKDYKIQKEAHEMEADRMEVHEMEADRMEAHEMEAHQIEELFGQIANAQLYLHAVCWEWDGRYSPEYTDPAGIGKIYEESIAVVRKCIQTGMYEEAARLSGLIMDTEVFVFTDIFITLDLSALIREKLVTLDLYKVIIYRTYSLYRSLKKEKRVEEIFQFLMNQCSEVLMSWEFQENYRNPFLQFRNIAEEEQLEFPKLSEFWDEWIAFLQEEASGREYNYKKQVILVMLREAVLQHGGSGGFLKLMQSASGQNFEFSDVPGVIDCCKSYRQALIIGKEALQRMHPKDEMYSKIAIRIAGAAICAKDYRQAQAYCEEAFLSDMSPVNCLRCVNELDDLSTCKAAVTAENQKIAAGYGRQNGGYAEPYEHAVLTDSYMGVDFFRSSYSLHNLAVLEFFFGDFDVLIRLYNNNRPSADDMECGISLLLLLLLQDDVWGSGCKCVGECLRGLLQFSASEYVRGTKRQESYHSTEDGDIFLECISRWKSQQKLTEEKAAEYLAILEKWIERAFEKWITRSNSRQYKKAAGFVAALGEVKESRGEENGKNKTLAKYQEIFAKRNRENEYKDDFIYERGFGMYVRYFSSKDS